MQVLAKAAEEAVKSEYAHMEAAIQDVSKRGTVYTQPWRK